MFIPVVDEKDVYDARGRQINDINTIIEFVDQVILGHTDVTKADEDDDQAHFFTGSFGVDFYLPTPQQATVCRNEPTANDLAAAYPLLQVRETQSVAYDILTPPPEASL